MILGNAGVIAVIITATSSFVTSRGYNLPINVVLFIVGIFVIYIFATRSAFVRKWETFVENRLIKMQVLEESSTEDLLHFLEGYGVVREIVTDKSSLVGKTLSESNLDEKGLLVLGIERASNWSPIPKMNERIEAGDIG